MRELKPNRETRPNYKLQAAREQKMWTQEEAAEEVGVDPQTLWRWENGGQRPHPYALRKLCEVCGSTAEQIGFGQTSDDLEDTQWIEESARHEETSDEALPLASRPLDYWRSSFTALTPRQVTALLSLLRDETIMKAIQKQFDPAKRETLHKLLAAAGIAITGSQFSNLEILEQLERLGRALKKPSSIDKVTLHGLKHATESYWLLRLRGSIATPDLLDAALAHYRTITQLLQSSLVPTTRTFLTGVASETALLAGKILSTDMDKHQEAQ